MMNLKKLTLLLIAGFSTMACHGSESQQKPHNANLPDGINFNIATSGQYPATSEKIYVDENLRATSKEKAAYYLEKELLGKPLLPNDHVTYDYWKDKQYFKDTPIVMYIYHYYDVKDGKLFFAANASELEGTTHYLFDGLAFWAHKNDNVKLGGEFSLGKPDGEFTLYDESGTVIEKFGYHNGVKYTNTQKTEDIYTPLIGCWEGELHNDHNFQLKTQVYDFKANGNMDFYQNIYYNGGDDKHPTWEITDYGEDTKATGSWKFIQQADKSGTMEFYYKGKIAQKAAVSLIGNDEFVLKTTSLDAMFDQTYVGKEVRFKRK